MKQFLLTAALILASLPAMAHTTKPTDTVSVEASTYAPDGITETSYKTYTKPWNQIKIDKTTTDFINNFLSVLSGKNGYRFTHITLFNGKIVRAVMMDEIGTVVAIDIPEREYCKFTVGGQNAIKPTASCGQL